MIIDAHSHLNFPEFEEDFHEVLGRMRENRVFTLTVGTNYETSRKAVELANLYPDDMRAVIGLHPIYASKSYASDEEGLEDFSVEIYEKLIEESQGNIVAIGECGLDYFHSPEEEREKQKLVFRKQIDFAVEHNLPLMLHIRPSKGSMDAYEDALKILDDYPLERVRGDVHFFAGNLAIAEKFMKKNFYISFTGVITFADEYEKLLREIPLNRILSETDAPYVSPKPHRGKRNEPSHVLEVVKKIAEVKKLSFEEAENQIEENVRELFSLDF